MIVLAAPDVRDASSSFHRRPPANPVEQLLDACDDDARAWFDRVVDLPLPARVRRCTEVLLGGPVDLGEIDGE